MNNQNPMADNASEGDINVFIEVPFGGPPVQYRQDKNSGHLVVDRFLKTPMVYPGNYGFVPNTIALDGQPLDVLVCDSTPLIPGALLACRPIGVLIISDDSGPDEKILAVPSNVVSSEYDFVFEYSDLPTQQRHRVEYFFEHYKDLDKQKRIEIMSWQDASKAREIIRDSFGLFELNAQKKHKLVSKNPKRWSPTPIAPSCRK